MTKNEIAHNVKMTNDELKTFYIPENIPRSPTEKEYEDIMNSGMIDPEEYILTWFYDKGGEGEWIETEGEYDDI
jgi:hypothetical protein